VVISNFIHLTVAHMTKPTSRREFFIHISSVSAVLATGSVLSACGGGTSSSDSNSTAFNFGVASGDPLADRVMLWTHAKPQSGTAAVELAYEVSASAEFTTLVTSGKVTASEASGYTAKVDATGLSAGKEYFYRFKSSSSTSATGRTRTLPAAGATEVKFAVMSCANYPAGFFNVYGEASKSDAQFAIHLGDYIYEYDASGYASSTAAALGRVSDPTNEILSLSDYRKRHAQYKSDADLKVFHARMPMIAVWDDHEITNDTYKDGAENHTEATEGTFAARKAVALQAYHEWMPIRTGADKAKIYRSFDFGGLVGLHMLDTRLIGRDKQIGFGELLNPATQAAATATLSSPARQLLGSEQTTWLQTQLTSSTATWQVLGQQILMARMEFPLSVLSALNPTNTSPEAVAAAQAAITAYLTAKGKQKAGQPLTAAEADLLDVTKNPKLGYNLDAWDGYPAAREILLGSIAAAGKKLVVLAGDTHNAWHTDLKLRSGVKVGEEFATHSVSSPGLEAYLSTLPPAQIKGIFEGVVDDLKWMDASRRGFLKMTFTTTQAKGEWIFINKIDSRTYTVDTPVASEIRTYTPPSAT
jgi:alkaline phosphatase D